MSDHEAGSVQLWGILKEKIGVLAELRRLDEAIRLAKRMVSVACRAFRPEDPQVGESYELLGDLLSASGRVEESVGSYREAYDVFRAAEPADAPSRLRVGSALADAFGQLGNEEAAAEIYGELLKFGEQRTDCDPHVIANLHNSYAIALNHLKRDEEAESQYLASLESYVALDGQDNPLAALLCDHLGAFYLSRERFAEAIESYGRSLAIRQKCSSGDSQVLAQALSNLAVAHHSAADWEEAEAFYREAIQLMGGTKADSFTVDGVDTLRNYSALLRTLGRKRKATAIEKVLARAKVTG